MGDPYPYLTLRVIESGTYVITTNVTSDAYTWNGDIPAITINAQEIPVNYLLLGVLMVIGGLLIPKKKINPHVSLLFKRN